MGKPSASTRPPASAAFTPAQLAAADAARARADQGTPAVVREALLGGEITVGGVTLPVIMIGHVLLLEEIKSPLAVAGAGAPSNAQVCEALFVLNRPAREIRALLRAGADAFGDAVLEFSSTIPLRDLPAIGAALAAQLRAAEATVIGGSSAESEIENPKSKISSPSPASSGEATVAGPGAKKNAGQPATVRSAETSPPRPTA